MRKQIESDNATASIADLMSAQTVDKRNLFIAFNFLL